MNHFALVYNNSNDDKITFQPSETDVNNRIKNGYDLFENKTIPDSKGTIICNKKVKLT